MNWTAFNLSVAALEMMLALTNFSRYKTIKRSRAAGRKDATKAKKAKQASIVLAILAVISLSAAVAAILCI